ncbi:MAG: hypothetical protein EOM20_20300 [Spartobacteria bacterium]|nr:hypothetical protein [Spartobacteria bacterium]
MNNIAQAILDDIEGRFPETAEESQQYAARLVDAAWELEKLLKLLPDNKVANVVHDEISDAIFDLKQDAVYYGATLPASMATEREYQRTASDMERRI